MKRTGTRTVNISGSLVGHGGGICPAMGTLNGDYAVVITATGKPAHIL